MNLFSKIKCEIKENFFSIFLVVLMVLLIFVVGIFLVVLFSKDPKWIFKLLWVSENGESKCESQKFLGLGMFGILAVLLYSLSRKSAMKRFSKLHYLAQKIKEDPLLSFLVFLLVVIFLTLVGVLFSDCFQECIANFMGLTGEKNKKHEALKFLGIGMGGILIALQALMSYKRATAMEKTAEAQVDAVSKTEDGLRQERLKNAIEHLGHERDSVRLGGAYELFHLAEDNIDLRKTALDILCAHIRQTTGANEYRENHQSKPSEEVQSLLTLLFMQNHEVFENLQINLQGSWLNGANLRKARLRGAILAGAYLQRAKLDGAHLKRANLVEAHLEEASLPEAHLQEADLFEVRMQGAYLKQAQLQGACLMGTSLQAANLADAHLQGTYLMDVKLQVAYLQGSRLQGAYLSGVYLQGATLSGAKLQGAGEQRWTPSTPFASRIRRTIDKRADLSRLVFGGIEQGGVDLLCEGLSDDKIMVIRECLRPHIGKPISRELPEDSGAITGAYTEEEAEQWIAEHEKAMSEVPRDDS